MSRYKLVDRRQIAGTCLLLAAEACFQSLKSQAAATIEYLAHNPAVSDALNDQRQATNAHSWLAASAGRMLEQLLSTYGGHRWGPFNRCTLVWQTVDDHWFELTARSPIPSRGFTFEEFSTVGQALVQKLRADYAADESEYQHLLAFNDRYTGLERFERAHASYRRAFQNDDVAGMLSERKAVLQGLEQARARKELLTKQSADLTQYDEALADSVIAIDREGLTSFVSQQAQTDIGELRRELANLRQTAPGNRGDISPKLELFRTRMGNIQIAIRAGRSMKAQAEQTRRILAENEGAARRVLDAANGEELKGAFDDEFSNSANELIDRFGALESSDLRVIATQQEDIEAARRKLAVLQNQILGAEAKYDRAKKLDVRRQVVLRKTAEALSELARPEKFRTNLEMTVLP